MEIHTLGIDLGKTAFHAVGFHSRGEIVLRRRFSRPQLVAALVVERVRVLASATGAGAALLGVYPSS